MIQIAAKKSDPTVTGTPAEPAPGTHPAVPVSDGSDWAGDKKYAENPDKPDPSSIAQVEIRPDEK